MEAEQMNGKASFKLTPTTIPSLDNFQLDLAAMLDYAVHAVVIVIAFSVALIDMSTTLKPELAKTSVGFFRRKIKKVTFFSFDVRILLLNTLAFEMLTPSSRLASFIGGCDKSKPHLYRIHCFFYTGNLSRNARGLSQRPAKGHSR